MPIEDKNSIILETAMKHFSRKGFEGARVDEIAEEAGVNKATLYYRIGNKQALYQRVFHEFIEHIFDDLTQRINAELNPESKLKIYIEIFANTLQLKPQTAPLILREVAKEHPDICQESIECMINIRKILENILQQGIDQNIFKPTNPYLIHILIVGTLNFYAASQPLRHKISENTRSEKESQLIREPVMQIANDVTIFILNSISLSNNQT